MDTFLQSQIPFILTLQTLPGLTGLMKFFSALGSEELFLILLPLVYLCLDSRTGARLAFVLLLGDAFNAALKLAFHLPRPYWIDSRVQSLATETTYGMPSGHAENATGIWFFLASAYAGRPAARQRARWGWVAAALIVFGISFSRLYLGVHFPSDVLGGWLFGGLFLFTFLRAEPWVTQRLGQLTFWGQVGAVTVTALTIILVGAAILALTAGSPDPAAWAGFAGERSLTNFFTDAGSLFGIGLGLVMATRWARFNAGGPIPKRLTRLIIGLVIVGLVYSGLRLVFPSQADALGLSLRFIRYALIGWLAIFAVPWLCLKLKLAEPG